MHRSRRRASQMEDPVACTGGPLATLLLLLLSHFFQQKLSPTLLYLARWCGEFEIPSCVYMSSAKQGYVGRRKKSHWQPGNPFVGQKVCQPPAAPLQAEIKTQQACANVPSSLCSDLVISHSSHNFPSLYLQGIAVWEGQSWLMILAKSRISHSCGCPFAPGLT